MSLDRSLLRWQDLPNQSVRCDFEFDGHAGRGEGHGPDRCPLRPHARTTAGFKQGIVAKLRKLRVDVAPGESILAELHELVRDHLAGFQRLAKSCQKPVI